MLMTQIEVEKEVVKEVEKEGMEGWSSMLVKVHKIKSLISFTVLHTL
jgi:hypothetical protein